MSFRCMGGLKGLAGPRFLCSKGLTVGSGFGYSFNPEGFATLALMHLTPTPVSCLLEGSKTRTLDCGGKSELRAFFSIAVVSTAYHLITGCATSYICRAVARV